MIARRCIPSATLRSWWKPRSSGPRWTIASHMACTGAGSTAPAKSIFPAIPHMSGDLAQLSFGSRWRFGDSRGSRRARDHLAPLAEHDVGRVVLLYVAAAPPCDVFHVLP